MINNFKFNNLISSETISKLNKYIGSNPCCSEYPKCTHPKIQSDAGLLQQDFMKDINSFIIKSLSNYPEFNEKTKLRCWAYLQQGNTIIERLNWHIHQMSNADTEFSFIIYVTPTEKGTIFKDIHANIFYLTPEVDTLYVWNSFLTHAPDTGYHKKDRIVIAGNTYNG